MIKLLLVTSKYRPQMCGVGDYSALLVDYLRGLGYIIDVYSSGKEENHAAEPGVFRCVHWSFETIRNLGQWIGREKYTHVLLQYTPMGYSRKGAFPPIALLPRLLRGICPECQVITTLHEMFYVTRLSEIARIPRNLSIGTAQRFLLPVIAGGSSGLVVTTKERYRFVMRLSRLLRWKNKDNIREIPVGTNIEPIQFDATEQYQLREKHGLIGKFVLGTFSQSAEPGMVLTALQALHKTGLDAYLLAVGAEPSYFFRNSPKLHEMLSPYIVCTSKVAAKEVSQYLQIMDVYLLPLLDGVSTRRGTLLAALAHGLPIVGTHGRSTDPWMRETTAFRLTLTGDTLAFEKAVLETSQSLEQQYTLRREAMALFQQRFNWSAIAGGYQEMIEAFP